MSKYIPKTRPKISKEDSIKIATHYLGSKLPPLLLIGIRGYYLNSMGEPNVNDFNLYDDACVILGEKVYKTFNFNTDPSFVKRKSDGKPLAVLNKGVYKFYRGKHQNKYNALRAYPEGVVLPCTRDGKPSTCSFVNIHKGGETPSSAGVTWSEGCQTVPKRQWADFIETVYLHMSRHNLSTIDYILLDEQDRKRILR